MKVALVLWLVMTHPTEEWRWIEVQRGLVPEQCAELVWDIRSAARRELHVPRGWGHTAVCLVEDESAGP